MRIIRLSKEQGVLILILGIAFFLRFYRLDFQSFWLDELHTAIEADPSLSWKELFAYLNCCDQHPPLFFILEKLLFTVFGHTEFVARALPAAAGTVSVWVIYLLGKELYSMRLGLIAATLICFNYFHIYYSQEARPYAFLFLFTSLSFLFLIRVIRNPSRKASMWYCICTLMMLFSHYFALFACAAQAVIAALFILWEREHRKLLLKHLAASALIIGICFSPWLSFLASITAIKSFWIPPVTPGFAIDFFYEYFGSSDLLKPFLLLFLILSLMRFFRRENISGASIKQDPFPFAFLICFLWISISYLVPYIRSILVVPMLVSRYTIIVLPAFILILSFGIDAVHNRKIQYTLLLFFCLLSLIDLSVIKGHYTRVHKSQFRELAKIIASDSGEAYPVIAEVTAWHQQYYLKRYGALSVVIGGKMEVILDSILAKKGRHAKTVGFWITDAHGGKRPSRVLAERIDSTFMLVKQQDLYDAWLRLYVSRSAMTKHSTLLDYRSFATNVVELNGDKVVAIWDKQAVSAQVRLPAGLYSVNMQMNGTPVKEVFPHINVAIDDIAISAFYTGADWAYNSFSYRNDRDTTVMLKISMDNDANSTAPTEDRNAFIKSISFLKLDN